MLQDDDMRPFAPPPEEYFSPFMWDGADQMVFRPISRFFAVDPAGEAINVNALDEVPDSSFFQNRIGTKPMTPEQFALGSCAQEPPLDTTAKITISGAKPNGANPGFIVKDSVGRSYLLKFDGLLQPERATSADVVGSILYHAAGYHAPCNRVVFFDRRVLQIESDATSEDSEGDERPLRDSDIQEVLSKAVRLPDGRYRASASLFLPGKPLGPFGYEGTRDDDPNDVVAHEDRRELRGGYLIAAWLNHFDAREQNTLDVWMESARGRGHVRHYYIDFGDCFGSLWDWDGISRRLGPSGYMKLDHILRDIVTLGLVERPWERATFGPAGQIFGYYGRFDDFDPDAWYPGYPNPAFGRRSERDTAWMARILARIGPEHLQAAVAAASFSNPFHASELLHILEGRRERILRRFLSRLSPLAAPAIEPASATVTSMLCLDDLLISSGTASRTARAYRGRAYPEGDASKALPLQPRAEGTDRVCVPLPSIGGASQQSPAYLIVDVRGVVRGREQQEAPARVHLYDFGGGRYLVVALERPDNSDPP